MRLGERLDRRALLLELLLGGRRAQPHQRALRVLRAHLGDVLEAADVRPELERVLVVLAHEVDVRVGLLGADERVAALEGLQAGLGLGQLVQGGALGRLGLGALGLDPGHRLAAARRAAAGLVARALGLVLLVLDLGKLGRVEVGVLVGLLRKLVAGPAADALADRGQLAVPRLGDAGAALAGHAQVRRVRLGAHALAADEVAHGGVALLGLAADLALAGHVDVVARLEAVPLLHAAQDVDEDGVLALAVLEVDAVFAPALVLEEVHAPRVAAVQQAAVALDGAHPLVAVATQDQHRAGGGGCVVFFVCGYTN